MLSGISVTGFSAPVSIRPHALPFKAIWIFAAERELMKGVIKYLTQKMYLGIRIFEC